MVRFALVLALATGLAGPVAAREAGTLLVVNRDAGSVSLLDAASGRQRARIPVGFAPHEIAVAPGGALAAVSLHGDRDRPGSAVVVLDVRRAAIARTIDVGQNTRPHGLAWRSERELVATAEGTAEVVVIDAVSGQVVQRAETGQRGSHLVALAPGGKLAFVTNRGSGTLTVLDLAEEGRIAEPRTGIEPEGLVVSPDGKSVWVANRGADTLTVVEAATLRIEATLPCVGMPLRLAFTPDGRRVLVACARSGEIALFDASSGAEVARRKLDLQAVHGGTPELESAAPVGLLVAPDGASAWVATTGGDVVATIDVKTLEVQRIWHAGAEPDGLAYSAVVAKPSKRSR